MLGRIVIYDIVHGLRRNSGKLILFLVFVSMLYLGKGFFFGHVGTMMRTDRFGAMGLFSCIIGGIEEYIPTQEWPFTFPAEWVVLVAFIPFLYGDYISADLQGIGLQKILRTGRGRWWFGKCIWILVMAVIYMVLLYGLSWLAAALFHSWQPMHLDSLLYGNGFIGLTETPWELYKRFLVLPFLCVLTISAWTVVLDMIWEPTKAFMAVCIYLVAGIFYMSPYLIGNQLMLFRSDYLNPKGVNPELGIWMDIILIGMAVLLGYYYIQNKDLIVDRRI